MTSFAPPFGRSSEVLRAEIARHYVCSAGTTMARASAASDLYDLPRIEMWYFRHPRRWRDHVARGPAAYFNVRRLLRRIGSAARASWR